MVKREMKGKSEILHMGYENESVRKKTNLEEEQCWRLDWVGALI